MAESKRDTAGVIAPPPFIFLAALLFGIVMDLRLPSISLPEAIGHPLGSVVGFAGLGIAVAALIGFRRAGTSAEPWHPTTALVTDGLYRYSRNPMYVALTLIYLGVTAAYGGVWMLVLLLPALLVLHYGVIAREERYLEAKFGSTYRDYKASVRRWF